MQSAPVGCFDERPGPGERTIATDSDHRTQAWQTIYDAVAAHCRERGLDLAQALQVRWYNDAVAESLRLDDFGRTDALAIAIGNTREFWQRFLAAAESDAELRDCENPVERYAMDVVNGALAAVERRCAVSWAHTVGEGVVAMQRLAQVSGLAYLSPAHLAVHPHFGPWIALRAVVVVDVEGPSGPPPKMDAPCGGMRAWLCCGVAHGRKSARGRAHLAALVGGTRGLSTRRRVSVLRRAVRVSLPEGTRNPRQGTSTFPRGRGLTSAMLTLGCAA